MKSIKALKTPSTPKIYQFISDASTHLKEAIFKTFLLNEYNYMLNSLGVNMGFKDKKIIYDYFPRLEENSDKEILNKNLLEARIYMVMEYSEYLPVYLYYAMQMQTVHKEHVSVLVAYEDAFEAIERMKDVLDIHLAIDCFYNPIEKKVYESSHTPSKFLKQFMNSFSH